MMQHYVGMKTMQYTIRYDDLDDLAGSWVQDLEFDKALAEMDNVDESLWK